MADTPPAENEALAAALESVGDRWSLLVVAALLDGPRRFGDIERELESIAPNVLTARLRALETDGVVAAEAYSQRPPRFLYSLTAAGRELAGPVHLLADWGARRRHAGGWLRHDACGTPLEARLYCPVCEQVVDADAAEDVHFA